VHCATASKQAKEIIEPVHIDSNNYCRVCKLWSRDAKEVQL